MRILVHREVGTKLPATFNHRARDAFPFPFLGLRKGLLNGLDDQRTNRSTSLCRSAAEQIMQCVRDFNGGADGHDILSHPSHLSNHQCSGAVVSHGT
jgi:hypothetical protein